MQFEELNIMPEIRRALMEEKYEKPTPIQEKAIPVILEKCDLLGCAQTGTGKTAAFAIPTLQLLSEEGKTKRSRQHIRTLVITPTRELALQIYESFSTYGKYTNLRYCVIFGGVSQKPQEEELQKGADILIATPGRLNDLINQKVISIKDIEILILDEADRMLDMGFIHDVKKIISMTPESRQTLLFSATMPPAISRMADTILKNPRRVEVTPQSTTVESISQYLYYIDKENKKALLLHILQKEEMESVLIFTRTKHGADRVAHALTKAGISAQAIHGDKSQGARQRALGSFKEKKLRALVATDIAARGIDIDELSHVINFDIPEVPETYVHRIGRTGRAGQGGTAVSFCNFDEMELLEDIERLIRKHLIVISEHPYPMVIMTKTIKETRKRPEKKEQKPSPKRKVRMGTDGNIKEKRSSYSKGKSSR